MADNRRTRRGHGPDLRVALALERTVLAWVRTGVALIGLGVLLARFVLFLEQTGVRLPGAGRLQSLGIALVAAAGVLVALAGVRHLQAMRRWRAGEADLPAPGLALAVVAIVAGAAAFALYAVWP